jgi:hypothetical protein
VKYCPTEVSPAWHLPDTLLPTPISVYPAPPPCPVSPVWLQASMLLRIQPGFPGPARRLPSSESCHVCSRHWLHCTALHCTALHCREAQPAVTQTFRPAVPLGAAATQLPAGGYTVLSNPGSQAPGPLSTIQSWLPGTGPTGQEGTTRIKDHCGGGKILLHTNKRNTAINCGVIS